MTSNVVLVTGSLHVPAVVNAMVKALTLELEVIEVTDTSDSLRGFEMLQEYQEPKPLMHTYPVPGDTFYREPTRIRKADLSPAKRLLQKRQRQIRT